MKPRWYSTSFRLYAVSYRLGHFVECRVGVWPSGRQASTAQQRTTAPVSPGGHWPQPSTSCPPSLRFGHQEEMSSISIRYSVFKRRIALATADSYCLE